MKQTERGNATLIAIIVLAVAAGGYVFLSSSNPEDAAVATNTAAPAAETDAAMQEDKMADDKDHMSDDAMMDDKADDAMMKDEADGAMMKDEAETVTLPPAPAAQELTAGTFTTYSDDKLALAEDGDVFVFFSADWCGKCQALEKDLNDNLSSIPGDVHILEANFDRDTDLKVKYGVNKQHTIVQVDANGNEVRKLPGGLLTLDSILAAR